MIYWHKCAETVSGSMDLIDPWSVSPVDKILNIKKTIKINDKNSNDAAVIESVINDCDQ